MEFKQNPPVLQRVLVDYCQFLSCESDKSSPCYDSLFNRDSDSRPGASTLALVVVTIKDTVTIQAKYLSLSHSELH